MTSGRSECGAAPHWIAARPIAHRGLHGRDGLVENTVGAARAAIAHGFSIECDVQLTRDGEAVVFHDFELDRLTGASGAVAAYTRADLQGIAYRVGGERIVTLADFLQVIDGRVPLVCEIKSRFDGDLRLTWRVREIVAAYGGPIVLESFDPAPIAALRADPPCPLGIVAEAAYDDPEWSHLSPKQKRALAEVLHFGETRPDFLSYRVDDLPHAVPNICRVALGVPVIAWTVRTPAQRTTASRWADQIVFEGFLP